MQALQVLLPPPTEKRALKVIYVWGVSGAGKSHYVRQNAPNHDSVTFDGKNFLGYRDSPEVYLEDLDPRSIPNKVMLKFLDVWPASFRTLYGEFHARWTTVYITANHPPEDWKDPHDKTFYPAFARRITDVIHMPDPFSPLPTVCP